MGIYFRHGIASSGPMVRLKLHSNHTGEDLPRTMPMVFLPRTSGQVLNQSQNLIPDDGLARMSKFPASMTAQGTMVQTESDDNNSVLGCAFSVSMLCRVKAECSKEQVASVCQKYGLRASIAGEHVQEAEGDTCAYEVPEPCVPTPLTPTPKPQTLNSGIPGHVGLLSLFLDPKPHTLKSRIPGHIQGNDWED